MNVEDYQALLDTLTTAERQKAILESQLATNAEEISNLLKQLGVKDEAQVDSTLSLMESKMEALKLKVEERAKELGLIE